MNNNWLKQTKDRPLFENLLWSKPENKSRAGKLLIIGGNLHGFSAVAQSYAYCQQAGAGAIKVLLPDSLRRAVGTAFPDTIFCPSNKIGSFGQNSLSEFVDYADWSDLCLLCGDFGRNSETAILVEKFAEKYRGKLCLTKDSSNFFFNAPSILNRPDTLLVLNLDELQRILKAAKYTQAITSNMPLIKRVEALSELTKNYTINIVTYQDNNLFVTSGSRVSTTEINIREELWELLAACYISIWWMQNPNQIFEALTTAMYEIATII